MTLRSGALPDKCPEFIKGTCMSMCPEKERLLREREHLLHKLELADTNDTAATSNNLKGRRAKTCYGRQSGQQQYKADPEKIVKCFSRSAAGHTAPDPSDLRPATVLQNTVTYLLTKVAPVSLHDHAWVETYQFIADRLRAVRQDMVIQNLSVDESVPILEPIVRFLCYSAYRLCEEPIDNFDPKLNSTHLQECIKRLLVLYDEKAVSYNDANALFLKNQSEIEVLYTVLNLGDISAISRGLEHGSKNKQEQLALDLSISWLCGNYVRVCRLCDKLPPLALCVAATKLPMIRKTALAVMTTAFSSKTLRVPLAYLQTILKWSDMQKAVEECRHYGLSVTSENGETAVSFLKGTFLTSAKEIRPVRESWVEKELKKISFKDLMFPEV